MFLKRPQQKNLIRKADKEKQKSEEEEKNKPTQEEERKTEEEEEENEKKKIADDKKNEEEQNEDDQQAFSHIKRKTKTHKSGLLTASNKTAGNSSNFIDEIKTYKSSGNVNIGDDQRATSVYSVDTDVTLDHRAILERNEKIGEEILKGNLEEGIYRGLGAYKPIANKREGAVAAGKYTGLYGPVRGNQHVRMTLRIDYQPDICKDYKETGYCGWGDTCKFLHDRSDYKGGWQLEREWEEMQKKKQEKLQMIIDKKIRKKNLNNKNNDDDSEEEDEEDEEEGSEEEESEDEEGLPFACLICRKKWSEYSNPVVTQCNHYFCEKCAFEHYAKSLKCHECGKQTSGIFNSAHKIMEKIEKKLRGEHKGKQGEETGARENAKKRKVRHDDEDHGYSSTDNEEDANEDGHSTARWDSDNELDEHKRNEKKKKLNEGNNNNNDKFKKVEGCDKGNKEDEHHEV